MIELQYYEYDVIIIIITLLRNYRNYLIIAFALACIYSYHWRCNLKLELKIISSGHIEILKSLLWPEFKKKIKLKILIEIYYCSVSMQIGTNIGLIVLFMFDCIILFH